MLMILLASYTSTRECFRPLLRRPSSPHLASVGTHTRPLPGVVEGAAVVGGIVCLVVVVVVTLHRLHFELVYVCAEAQFSSTYNHIAERYQLCKARFRLWASHKTTIGPCVDMMLSPSTSLYCTTAANFLADSYNWDSWNPRPNRLLPLIPRPQTTKANFPKLEPSSRLTSAETCDKQITSCSPSRGSRLCPDELQGHPEARHSNVI